MKLRTRTARLGVLLALAGAAAACGGNAILGSRDGATGDASPTDGRPGDTGGDGAMRADADDAQSPDEGPDAPAPDESNNDASDVVVSEVSAEVGGPDASDTDASDGAVVETSVDVLTDAPAPDAAPDAPIDDVIANDGPSPDAMTMDAGGTDAADGGSIGDGSVIDAPCAVGAVMCTGSTACINLQTDPSNCGTCGTVCPATQGCSNGMCGCSSSQTLCGTTCVDTQGDNNNCGMCGRVCGTGTSCVMGACVCASGQTSCGMGATAMCVNTTSDNANCGMCGNACPAGRTCSMGACVCPTGQTGCGTGASATCVNTQTDNANCGACGNACTGGSTCVMGTCQCPMGQTRCGMGASATCVDTQTDTANCGACGTACPAGQVCNGGMCTVNCTMPLVRCGTGAAQSCANLQTDDQNCGACGTVCNTVPNSFGGICTTGSCRPICAANFANCNNMYADGCEVDTRSDVNNCASCGNRCPSSATNATAVTCSASRCTPTCQAPTPTTNFQDCNASVTDGCETNVLSSNQHCGACNNACATGQTCIAGSCTALSCNDLHTRAPALPSGVYFLDPDGTGPGAPFQAYCDMTSDGGGWTLLLKLDGRLATPNFSYSSALWTSTTTLNTSSVLPTDLTEAKLAGYSNVAFTNLRLVIRSFNVTPNVDRQAIFPLTATSLQALFSGPYVATNLTRAGWIGLFNDGAMQANCRTEGVNVSTTAFSFRARLGIIGNQEDDCNTPDSYIGIGLENSHPQRSDLWLPHPAVGDLAPSNWANGAFTGDRNIRGFAWVYVR